MKIERAKSKVASVTKKSNDLFQPNLNLIRKGNKENNVFKNGIVV